MSDVAILPADKGRAAVLMNKEKKTSYKFTQLLQSGTWTLARKDPAKTQETKMGRVLRT